MEHHFHHDTDLLHDGLSALHAIHTGEDAAAFCAKNDLLNQPISDSLRDCLTLILKQERQLGPIAAKPDEDFAFLFDAREQTCAYYQAFLYQPVPRDNETIQRGAVASLLDGDDTDEHFPTEKAFYQWIHAQTLDSGAKSDLIRLYGNFAQYQKIIDRLAEQTAAVLRVFLPDFQPHIDRMSDEIAQRFKPDGSYSNEFFDIQIDAGEVYDLYVTTTQPNAIWLNHYALNHVSRMHFGLGIFEVLERLREASSSDDILQKKLKLLADPTKFQILKYLREGRKYSAQISAKLALTSATISHHMNQLGAQQLVRFVKEGTRVYYELNEDILGYTVRDLRRAFLSEPS